MKDAFDNFWWKNGYEISCSIGTIVVILILSIGL